MTPVYFHSYYLTPRHAMNAVSTAQIRQGALLKWEMNGKTGYSDLHPWPEFGDWPLANHLEGLRQGQMSALVKQSLWFAHRDAEARAAGKKLLSSLPTLKNNFILQAIPDVKSELLQYLQEQGFEVIKVKMGKDLISEIPALAQIAEAGFRIRLDFNSTLTLTSFKSFVQMLDERTKQAIDYVEDPFLYNEKDWHEANQILPLALDQEVGKINWQTLQSAPFKTVVVKPAKTVLDPILENSQRLNLKMTITTNMDHPVGQIHAAAYAQEMAQQNPHSFLHAGCMTHLSYQPEAFSRMINAKGPYVLPVQGTGIGFDELLAEVPWQPLARL